MARRGEARTLGARELLQALDMRTLNFKSGGAEKPGARDDWSGGTVLAGTGSLDLLLDLPPCAGPDPDPDPDPNPDPDPDPNP